MKEERAVSYITRVLHLLENGLERGQENPDGSLCFMLQGLIISFRCSCHTKM